MQTRRILTILITAFFLTITLSCEATTKNKDRNDILFDAMSPYEDLTEYALANNKTRIKKTLASWHSLDTSLNAVLSEVTVKRLNHNFNILVTAEKNNDYASIALYAVNSYKVLVDELEANDLAIPIEVAKLDYIGFEIHALLKQKQVNWKMISEIIRDGRRQWYSLRGKISDKKLIDVMDTSINGLLGAAKSKNIEMLGFAAQVDLDLVDLLEGYFENKK